MKKYILHLFLRYYLILNYLKKFYYKKLIYNYFKKINSTKLKNNFNKILIDGYWENPNYWLRINLIFKGLNISKVDKVGLIGKYSRKSVKQSFSIFQVNELIDYKKIIVNENEIKYKAKHLLANSKTNKDLFNHTLPYDFPSELFYDSLLKELATPTVNLNDPRLPRLIFNLLKDIEIAFKIFSDYKFSLFLCSHSIGATYGSLVWAAIKNKVKVICLYGNFGTSRFIKYEKLNQLTNHVCPTPSKNQFFNLDKKHELAFFKMGENYFKERLNSRTNDIGAKLAIHKKNKKISKKEILNCFNFKNKKIITVFTHHWSDFPHSLGLKNFIDFKEWFDITLEEASKNKKFIWMFKGHPISEKYNYSSSKLLKKFIAKNKDLNHIKIVPDTWNWNSIVEASDYFITCLGSIGFEGSALNKKVLLSDPGWYGHLGFGKLSNSKLDYINNLRTEWWKDIDVETSRFNALKFMGIYYCNPPWLSELTFKDDSEQNNIYKDLKFFLSINKKNFEREIDCIRSWYNSKEPNYHIFKKINYNFTK